ncbi:MAG: DUF512 domain-containing protein [Actinomycetota bacterium]|nr:DUF512 domain-containing protein [Actinomycetota bacterium]
MSRRADYGGGAHAAQGGCVDRVAADSPADRASIQPDDVLLAVDGTPITDIIEWQWLTDGPAVRVTLERAGAGRIDTALSRAAAAPWGIHFAEEIFDAVRTCDNRCEFCFMTQLPGGLRPALYVRDDDYRLSFLHGNFITLTNLTDADVERIAGQHLSPLYVSLHAIGAGVRARLMGARSDSALARFDELLDAGIDLHVQIVLVPDVNDGEILEQTLTWLAEREGVASVGVVPLGYTRHQTRYTESFESASAAAAVIEQIERWQAAFRKRDGVGHVYAADEFFLNAGHTLPAWEVYDEFPQYENGIGLARAFVDEFAEAAAAASCAQPDLAGTRILTGELAAPLLRDAVASLGEPVADVIVIEVRNDFFGGNVSVAGLLAASDIVAAIRADATGGRAYLLPDVIFNADGLTLDDVTLDDLIQDSGANICVVSCDAAGLAGVLLGSPKPEHETR